MTSIGEDIYLKREEIHFKKYIGGKLFAFLRTFSVTIQYLCIKTMTIYTNKLKII